MESTQKTECRSLRIGEPAPDFRARSTTGEIQLSKLRGRWVIFFSHPADFTPVCSTEFAELARRQSEFDALETSLLGLSVDSLYAHMAWVRAIRETLGAEVRFPIIEDPSMAVGRAYGMIDEQSADSMAMRSTFFIDPDGVIRAITCYPHNVGRSVEEMLRLLKALQTVGGAQTLAPEGWREGQPLLCPPSDIAEDRQDWFCRFVDAP
ncbi:peroxiredoxin (alkyl hydroperoxide reductase subunit C) [Sphingobium sp. OAS761]|uniref:peroxiredoxin n=1 Tax=Sphingobium sp. OAS761 TaxID=2817901 RepID=UPI00209D9025|nr:peroxiredoxin [Sphingobium sp. OAS761]MCP1472144.1 peroxiredoxin (alkyl hydroperoxide reductase subunit C) [Sphingobium sp. OAS761]